MTLGDGRIRINGVEGNSMTEMLDKAFRQASNLPEREQDEFAAFILAELADEQRWSKALSTSSSRLSELAAEARREYEAGETQPLDSGAE